MNKSAQEGDVTEFLKQDQEPFMTRERQIDYFTRGNILQSKI